MDLVLKMGETNPFDVDSIKTLVDDEKDGYHATAYRLIDSKSTEFLCMTPAMTNLAQSLSQWIMNADNQFSEHSMKKFHAVRVRSSKFMKLQEDSSFALSLEIFALNDLLHAFRSATGAGGRIGLGAANKHLADLLWDSESEIAFEWEELFGIIHFEGVEEISLFNSKDHPQIMWLLYAQIIFFITMALDLPEKELTS